MDLKISDHCIIRYRERIMKDYIDDDRIRKNILKNIRKSLNHLESLKLIRPWLRSLDGTEEVRYNPKSNSAYIIREGVVVTCFSPKRFLGFCDKTQKSSILRILDQCEKVLKAWSENKEIVLLEIDNLRQELND